MKYLSYRIRRNGFEFVKKNNINYKSIYQQIKHDLRIENIENGYLKNDNENVYMFEKDLLSDKDLNENYLKDLWKNCENDYKKHNNKKLDYRTKPFLTHILSFENSFMLDIKKTRELQNYLKEFVLQEFGNFITIVGHRDETSLHFHITTLNYNLNNHKTIGRNLDTSLLQDKISNFLKEKEVDYGHQRGLKKDLTKSKHRELLENRKEGLKVLKNEYNELFLEYKKLVNVLKNKINEILEIKNDKRTTKKLEKILKSVNKNLEEIEIDEIKELITKINKSILTTNKVQNAIKKL